jgi:formylglycine-generating enzyme required for sulfatase activity
MNDWYGSYSPAAQTDPTGAKYGIHKVIRGNAWSDTIWRSRSSFRGYHDPKRKTSYLGFRLVRQP